MQVFTVKTLEDWQQVVDVLIPQLKPGMMLTLSGELGAGKTTFTQVLAKALGAKKVPKSPTFSLLDQHVVTGGGTKIRRVLHIDAYRLEKEEDARVLNLEEELQMPGTLAIIEWPEQIAGWLKRRTSAVMPMSIQLRGDERIVTLGTS